MVLSFYPRPSRTRAGVIFIPNTVLDIDQHAEAKIMVWDFRNV